MWVDLGPDTKCLISTAQAMDDDDWSQLYLKITLLQVSRNQTRKKNLSNIYILSSREMARTPTRRWRSWIWRGLEKSVSSWSGTRPSMSTCSWRKGLDSGLKVGLIKFSKYHSLLSFPPQEMWGNLKLKKIPRYMIIRLGTCPPINKLLLGNEGQTSLEFCANKYNVKYVSSYEPFT